MMAYVPSNGVIGATLIVVNQAGQNSFDQGRSGSGMDFVLSVGHLGALWIRISSAIFGARYSGSIIAVSEPAGGRNTVVGL